MGLFDSNKKSASPSLPSLPVQEVSLLRQQGLSDNQIVQSLQREGYKTHQVFDAMSQADLVSGAPRPLDDLPPMPDPQPAYSNQQNMPSAQDMPSQQLGQTQYSQYPYPPQPTEPILPDQTNYEKMEEIAESIIEEKWTDFSKGVAKIVDWKEKTELKINELDTKVDQLRQSFDDLTKSLLVKMSDYDRNMGNVGSDIKAMQKVFQQMLPSFTENVNELSRITKNIKSKNQ